MSEPGEQLQVLLVDDEEVVHQSVGGFLEDRGHALLAARTSEEALELFDRESVDLVISDIRMPGMDGLELLALLKERASEVEVILITGYAEVETAIAALRKGAVDFLRKPFELGDLLASVERTRRYRALRRERDRYRQQLAALRRGESRSELVGESRALRRVRELIAKVAASENTTVLITGESGTGKELVARAIHDQSPRAQAPFVAVNCTALPETLLENELFGHEKGAFTGAEQQRKGLFEMGEGGTLFLDEIGDMSPSAQLKLLRVLEERRLRRVGGGAEIVVDVRLIAATSRDLEELAEQGAFRRELLFRLDVFRIATPPLRQRQADVLLLARYFLGHFTAECGKELQGIEPEAEAVLANYPFPGNVRELRNRIERAVILSEGARLRVCDLGELAVPAVRTEAEQWPLDLAQVEERAIRRALAEAGGNQSQAARLLGIGRDALRYRLNKYRIE